MPCQSTWWYSNIQSAAKIFDGWHRYFDKLLNADNEQASTNVGIPPTAKDLPERTDDFTVHEVQEAIKWLNNYKAPGCDYGISPEALKYGGHDLQIKLTKACNVVKYGL